MCPITWIMMPVVTHLIVVVPSEQSNLNLRTSVDSIPKHVDHDLFNSTGELWCPNPADECGAMLLLEHAIMGLKDASWVIQHALQQCDGDGGNASSRFSVTWLAVTSITTWPSSWTLSVTASAVTSSITHSAGVTIPIWRWGGIMTEGVIHLDSPDEQPSVLAATASWTHRWFRDGCTGIHFS